MAPSLQGLIEFLLNEIAICGSQGANSSEVLKSIETFYQLSPADTTQRQQAVDRRFQVKVWSWLTHNPEVSVGKDREWNQLSLDEVEQLDKQRPDEANEPAGRQQDSSATSASRVRIFVSNERTWLAIAGHEPDDSKITNAEWGLLSVIARFKSNGIPQTDLVRISGQDKRSVPKRTDALESKGYIAKRPVQLKKARTSLCTLRRFLKATTEQQASTETMIDFETFVQKLFKILKECRIISRNDLKTALGFADQWRWRILSRALRKLEQIGVLQRVRAESQYERLHPCVMLIREPTEKDLEKFHEFSRLDLIRSRAGADLEEDLDMDDAVKQGGTADEGSVVVKKEANVVGAGRVVPSWTPDRNLSNQIFDVIDKTGTSGITNSDLNRTLFGLYFRRPSESILHRLVDCWQLSQPPHLRHLAIVRDTGIERTVFYYVHYSARNFAKLVGRGEASWEAVEYSSKKGKSLDGKIAPADAKAQLDRYGFPVGPLPQGLLKNGNASLFEGIAVCRPSNYCLTGSDPVVVQLPDGTFGIQSANAKYTLSSSIVSTSHLRRQAYSGFPQRQPSLPKVEESLAPPVPVRDIIEMPPEATLRTPRTWKSNKKKLRGLPKKERFEAMGMDETWVEYNVLLMDRPTPGVYVTPLGKRRPAGKKQGRPRQSRLAIFKSDKLTSFPWFVREKSDSEIESENLEHAADAMVPREYSLTPLPPAADAEGVAAQSTADNMQIGTRALKRTWGALGHTDSPTPVPRAKSSKSHGGRLSKKPRLEDDSRHMTTSVDSEGALPNFEVQVIRKQPESVTRRKSDAVHALEVERDEETTPKRRRVKSPERNGGEQPSQILTTAQTADQPLQVPTMSSPRDAHPEVAQTPSSIKQRPHPTGDRGGSIGLLRRRIVMEIVEKAGGAYPAGTEMWYPFTTALKKANRKENPDNRTIRTAIKHLVDAGKLKQLTFSGRDSKGKMVIRTIVAKPEMSPDDPLIKDMQQKVLSVDRPMPGYVYSPHIEADSRLSRSGGAPMAQNYYLPIAAGETVALQQMPADIRYEEERRERKIRKTLLKHLAGERLMKIHRPSAQDPSSNAPTIIAPPEVKRRGRPKALIKISSIIGARSILMNPVQSYHAPTGTFGTGIKFVGRLGRPRTAVIRRPRLGSIAEDVAELSRMAQHTEDLSSANNQIMQWELDHEDFFDAIPEGHPYIDQAVNDETFHAAPIDGKIRFVDSQPVQAPPPPAFPMQTRSQDLQYQPPLQPIPLQPIPLQPAPRRLDRMDTQPPLPASIHLKTDSPRPPFRRQRLIQSLPEHLVQKLMVAIVAVRVLAGGAEGKLCDWDLVAAAFPAENPELVQQRAKNILSRNRLQILKMQGDFQDKFLEAYADDKVPQIDYNHLDKYNWPALIEWAVIELEVYTSDQIPSLPATREQFDSIFELREEPVSHADELFNITTGVSVAYKRRQMTQVPFAIPMDKRQTTRPGPRTKELARLEVIKTWVRANVVTPEQSYRPEEAKTILSRFPGPLIDTATRSLMTDRVIHMGNKGRLGPGRNYDITEHLLNQINRKRTIDLGMLRSAANFKTTVLDPKLQKDGICEMQYYADDGTFLALINLANAGHITLHPRNPPRDKFGLTDGGYLTRQMDKSRVRFAIDVRVRPSYVYGNPIQERASSIRPPLSSKTDPDLPPRIPFWYDIHGYTVTRIWEMVVATVLGCVATREGASAEIICSMIKPAMGAWELELLLEWLAEVGAVSREGRDAHAGWKVNEWWWLVLS